MQSACSRRERIAGHREPYSFQGRERPGARGAGPGASKAQFPHLRLPARTPPRPRSRPPPSGPSRASAASPSPAPSSRLARPGTCLRALSSGASARLRPSRTPEAFGARAEVEDSAASWLSFSPANRAGRSVVSVSGPAVRAPWMRRQPTSAAFIGSNAAGARRRGLLSFQSALAEVGNALPRTAQASRRRVVSSLPL